ncbi:MAG: sel1 repeat family protein [Sulfuriflexus sp.]|nr:sel1 repeat family protein [Sulfuriflexus sp.]
MTTRNVFFLFMILPVLAFADTSDYVWNEQFIKKSAEAAAGKPRSQYDVGNMYLKGQGTGIDESKAFEWIKKAAASGYLKAQFKVGFMYLKGLGTKKSYSEAEKWLRKAANKNYAPAQYYLAGMYRDGQHVSKNYDKSLSWLKKAKANGFWKAAHEYGKLIALTQRGVAKKIKPKQVAVKRVEPKSRAVVNKPTVVATADSNLRGLLLRSKWLERGKPAKYLPSEITQCKNKNDGLYCVSKKDLKGKRGNTTFTYRIIINIKHISETGEFSASYRNNILSSVQGKPVVIPGDDGEADITRPSPIIKTGLQRTVHSLECQLDNLKQISCVKDLGRSIKLTRR